MWLSTLLAIDPKGCTVGNITQVEISDDAFPFGYDQTQFDLCLDPTVMVENLYAICEKVDDDEFQKIILKKLKQVKVDCVSWVVAEEYLYGSVESLDLCIPFAFSFRCFPFAFLAQQLDCLDQRPV